MMEPKILLKRYLKCALASAVLLSAGWMGAGSVGAAETEEWIDTDEDGRKETRIVSRDGVRAYAESDEEGDGTIDVWRYYDDAGVLRRRQRDTNQDGKPDRQVFMVHGRQVVLREYDSNFDGKVDKRALMKWDYNASIKMQQYMSMEYEEDSNFDGLIDEFRKRGQKGPDLSKVGVVMNTAFTVMGVEPPVGSGHAE